MNKKPKGPGKLPKDAGSSLDAALSASFGDKPIRQGISVGDVDFFSVRVTGRSSLNVALRGLKIDASLELLNGQGQTIGSSNKKGKKPESIEATVEEGTFYIKVQGLGRGNKGKGKAKGRSRNSAYQLFLKSTGLGQQIPQITPPPTPAPNANTIPVLSTNAGKNVGKNATVAIGGDVLKATDAEQLPGALNYSLTSAPQAGDVLFNNAPIQAGATFTQADIDAGRLSYKSKPGLVQIGLEDANEFSPVVSGADMAWFEGSEDGTVLLYSKGGAAPITLATDEDGLSSATLPGAVQISGSKVYWMETDSLEEDSVNVLKVYDGSTTKTIEGSEEIDFVVGGQSGASSGFKVSGASVAWAEGTTLYLNDGSTTKEVASFIPAFDGTNFEFVGSNLYWTQNDSQDGEIFMYDGKEIRQITNNQSQEFSLSASEAGLAWIESTPQQDDDDIFAVKYRKADGTIMTIADSDNVISGGIKSVKMVGSGVAWLGETEVDENEFEADIYYFDGAQTRVITDGGLENPQFVGFSWQSSGSNLAWFDYAKEDTSFLSLYVFDGVSTQIMADGIIPSGGLNISLKDSQIAFSSGIVGEEESSVDAIVGNIARQDAFGFTVADGAGGSASGSFKLTIDYQKLALNAEAVAAEGEQQLQSN